MKKTLFAITMATVALAGCQKETFVSPAKSDEAVMAVKAIIADDATRTSLAEDGSVYHVNWTADDKILIIDENNKQDKYYAVEGGAPTATFYFSKGDTITMSGKLAAWYPFYVGNGKLSSVQEYCKDGIKDTPMYAETTAVSGEVPAFAFKNLCGVIKLNVTSSVPGTKILNIDIKADQGMSGEFEILDDAAVVSGTEGVSIYCGTEGVEVGTTPVPFFFSVPANTYTGMEISVTTTDGKTKTIKMKSGASIKVERSQVVEGAVEFNDFAASTVSLGGKAILPSGQDFNALIKQQYDPDATYSSFDPVVRKIAFNTNCPLTNGTIISDLSSEKPVYLVYDASGVVNINTPADEFIMASDGSYMFAFFSIMEEIVNLRSIDTSECEDMHNMFCHVNTTSALRSIDLSNFNTEKCTTMRSMFNGLKNLETLDMSKFNTENVEAMEYMFQYCGKLKSIDCSMFNTENVETMQYMFAYCYEAEDINVSSFDTVNCSDFTYFFAYCYKLQRAILTNFNTENALKLCNFFWHCHELTEVDVTSFSTASVTDIRSFFNRCDALRKFDVSWVQIPQITNTTYSGYFFYLCKSMEEMICNDTFDFGVSKPTYMPCANNTAYENRPGSVSGHITIYCDQDICDWFGPTGWRWVAGGLNANGTPTDPIPITFKHFQTGQELFTTWSTVI